MRSLLFIVIASLVPVSAAWPCAAPPPMRSVLQLVTAPNATLPGDGAILVTRHEVAAKGVHDGDEHWKLRDAAGHDVVFEVEDLGSSLERWIPATSADRDLVIVDEAGKKIATLHQTKVKSPGPAAPRALSLTSTASLADASVMQMGVPGGTTTLELAADPPADARFLTIEITGSGARVHSSIAPTAQQRKFVATSYAHKSCARGGPGAIFIGEHVAVRWVDSLGRRSSAAQITATKQH
ncbi:MAG: hypothetical protein ABJE66_25810 [Deltaproteobacteria bacterium]